MRNKELTAATRALSRALSGFGVTLTHQQAQHVLAQLQQEESYHTLTATLKSCRHQPSGPAVRGILVQVSPEYKSDDGDDDAFDAVLGALEFSEIPATLVEGDYVLVPKQAKRPRPKNAKAPKAGSLDELRRQAAEQVFESYDFNSSVEGSGGWEYLSGPSASVWTKPVYLASGQFGVCSSWAQLRVSFAEGSATPAEVTCTGREG